MIFMLTLLLVCLWLEASPDKWGAQPHLADPVLSPKRLNRQCAKRLVWVEIVI